MADKAQVLAAMSFGQRVAEDERDELVHYFVSTDVWNHLFAGDLDIIYGAKGSGKSALYTLLNARSSELFDREILLAAGENLRGTTAFHGLVVDPPASEEEFRGLWKLYFACLASRVFEEYGISEPESKQLKSQLAEAGLVPYGKSLQSILRSVFDYVKRAQRFDGLEGGVQFDPATGLPVGITGKITFSEPSVGAHSAGYRSVDSLLQMVDETLHAAGMRLWICLDRLDVAFAESPDLEKNALRALFKVYLDVMAYGALDLKIFLRTDIWNRIVHEGFREASHITRHATIKWDRRGLMSLVAERAVENASLCDYYRLNGAAVRGSAEEQEALFYRMCPDQVDLGRRRPRTFEWVLTRTQDASGQNAPRELIHFMNALRSEQVRQLETGETAPEDELLFSRAAFKEALPEVSQVRLEQTLYAEHPDLRDWLEQLRGEKTKQTASTLALIWDCSADDASTRASELVDVGFFEVRGDKATPEFWVPFLYRDALNMVQGSADGD